MGAWVSLSSHGCRTALTLFTGTMLSQAPDVSHYMQSSQRVGIDRHGDLAHDHAAPAQMQLYVITDDDQLERDHPLTGDGWLHEQSPIEPERERAVAAPADRVHLGDDLRPPAMEPVGWDQAADPR